MFEFERGLEARGYVPGETTESPVFRLVDHESSSELQPYGGSQIKPAGAAESSSAHLDRANHALDPFPRQLERKRQQNTDRQHAQHAADSEDQDVEQTVHGGGDRRQ